MGWGQVTGVVGLLPKPRVNANNTGNSSSSEEDTVTDLVQNLDEMNCVKSKDSKKYEWAATGCGVRIKLKN